MKPTINPGKSVMRFAPGDLIRNVKTNEDGKVIEAYAERGAAMYMVSVPVDSGGWNLGAKVAYWSEVDLDSSNGDSLGEDLFV
jgi:hypothetical protein